MRLPPATPKVQSDKYGESAGLISKFLDRHTNRIVFLRQRKKRTRRLNAVRSCRIGATAAASQPSRSAGNVRSSKHGSATDQLGARSWNGASPHRIPSGLAAVSAKKRRPLVGGDGFEPPALGV